MRRVTLTEIAARIHVHLRRFEADTKINRACYAGEEKPYYHAGAARAGAFIAVTYVSYRYTSHLRRADAERYLAWLDAGNVGTHYKMEREGK